MIHGFVYIFITFFFFVCRVYSDELQEPHFNEVDTCECGVHNGISGRIVGGSEATPNEYPWMAAIFSDGMLHCGGSLINDRYILTAGHCLKWSKVEELTVVLGLHDKAPFEYGLKHEGTVVAIHSLLVHEDFATDFTHDTDDVGLIRLKESVKFTTRISPVCLPENVSEEGLLERLSTVIGWGKTTENGISSRYLRKAHVQIVAKDECLNNSAVGNRIIPSMLCAYNYRVDACQGDSGGPLVQELPSEKMVLVGVVSWGIGCAKAGVPGIYSRVTHYTKWIASHTSDAKYCKRPK